MHEIYLHIDFHCDGSSSPLMVNRYIAHNEIFLLILDVVFIDHMSETPFPA